MAQAFDVAAFIDRQKIGRFQIRIIILCALGQFLDGFDTQAIAYAAPSLMRAWHMERAAMTPVFAAGILGILAGSLVIGPLADWFGRKTMLIAAMIEIAIFSLLTAQAQSLEMLLVFRFLTGLGLGGVIPGTTVMANEFAPRHRRATMVTLMACGFAIGAAVGGQTTAYLLPFGWQAIFYVGGVAPLLFALVLLAFLPESVRLLVLNGGERAKIARILRQMDPAVAIPPEAAFTVPRETRRGIPVARLFQDGRTAITLLLWTAFLMNLLALNFLNNWLPTVITGTGLAVEQAVRITTLFQFAGMAGVIVIGPLADRFGYFRMLGGAFLFAGLLTATIGSTGGWVALLALAIAGAGFCIISIQQLLSALSATVYPTSIRSTGTGWALGMGRIGSFLGPVIGGVLLGLHLPLSTIFYIVALPPFCGVLAVLAMAKLYGPKLRRAEDEAAPTSGASV